MTSNVWHCFCTYCTKEHRCLLHHYSIIMSQRLVVRNSVASKTKGIRPRLRPRPRPVWDQSCHKTAVSDPKPDNHYRSIALYHGLFYSDWNFAICEPTRKLKTAGRAGILEVSIPINPEYRDWITSFGIAIPSRDPSKVCLCVCLL